MVGPLRIAAPLLEQNAHGVLIRRKKVQQRSNSKCFCEPLQGIFIAGQSAPVDKDVESRIFSLDDNIETSGHRSESSGDIEEPISKSAPGNPINQCSDSETHETQDYTSFIPS